MIGRVEKKLHEAGPVAQVHEEQSSQVADFMRPSVKDDAFARVSRAQLAAGVRTLEEAHEGQSLPGPVESSPPMKFPYSMLLEFVQTKLDAHRVGALLTMAGFELEGIEQVEEDQVLDIKVVSNRGDGLSVFGLAREGLAKDVEARPSELYARAAGRFPGPSKPTPRAPEIAIRTESCSRYAYLLLENTLNGESPPWLQRRIRQAGWRPLSLLVDLGNYVMLELGQPVHAFDFDKLEGREISVREARAGERLVTLNVHDQRIFGQAKCYFSYPVAARDMIGGRHERFTTSR
mgnify:CR=1 FL=1